MANEASERHGNIGAIRPSVAAHVGRKNAWFRYLSRVIGLATSAHGAPNIDADASRLIRHVRKPYRDRDNRPGRHALGVSIESN
jgi:hypothetical protein